MLNRIVSVVLIVVAAVLACKAIASAADAVRNAGKPLASSLAVRQ